MKQLPKDLQKFILTKILKRCIPCAIILFAVIAVLFLFGDTLLGEENNIFKQTCIIIAVIIPFYVCGVPFKLLDTTFCGKIVEVRQELSLDNERSFKPSREGMFTKNTVFVTLITPSGKRIRRKCFSGRLDQIKNTEKFKVGDEIFHLALSDRTILIPKAKDTVVECAVCSRSNQKDLNLCEECGHTLVKDLSTIN